MESTYYPGQTVTVVASAAVQAHRFVGLTSGAKAAAGAAARGVTMDGATGAGRALEVITNGTAYVEAGAAFAAEALLTSDGDGRAVTAAAGNRVNAIALAAAGGPGLVVEVLIVPPIRTA